MKKGIFIAIEGGDGAGKDTQIELLRKDLREFDAVFTREPGGTALGLVLRDMLLHESHGSVSLLAEVFLFLADRAQHADEVIVPALKEGKVVVSNRAWISMVAYQLWGRNRLDMRAFVEPAIREAYKECPIDLAVILDVAPEIGMARQKAAGKTFDVMESMGMDARERIRRGFLDAAAKMPAAKVIDASRSIEEVHKDVLGAVRAAIAR